MGMVMVLNCLALAYTLVNFLKHKFLYNYYLENIQCSYLLYIQMHISDVK